MSEPRFVGRYELQECIGRGGMGAVYKALSPEGEVFAVKLMRKSVGAENEFLQRFLRETRISTQLNHPNIVRAYEALQDDDGLYLVMEYVDGGDANNMLIRIQRMREPDVLQMIHQVCQGLQHAHDAGLIHRDIKPQNIYLTRSGVSKLADLGLARMINRDRGDRKLTVQGQILGTPNYIPPEQAAGSMSIDVRADLYSTGATLFHLLCGQAPFERPTVYEILAAHMHADVPDPRDFVPSVSEATCEIIRKAMAKEPRNRPHSARELAEMIQAAAEAIGAPLVSGKETLPQDVIDASLRGPPQPVTAPKTERIEPVPVYDSTGKPGAVPVQRRQHAPGSAPGPRGLIRIALSSVTLSLVLYGRPFINLGKQRDDPNDLCLRIYPVGENKDLCNRISHLHARVSLEDGQVVVEDLGSRNGSLVDGQVLAAQNAYAIAGSGIIDIARVLRLHYQVQGQAEAEAVVFTRPENRADLVSAVIRGTARFGRDIVPVVAPEARSWPYDAFRVMLSEDGFLLAPGEAPVTFADGNKLEAAVPLRVGMEWIAAGAKARFDKFTWASFK